MEFLYEQIAHALQGQSSWETRCALQTLFEIFDLTSRTEGKAEIIKELDRHAASLNQLRQKPGVDDDTLDTILNEITEAAEKIHSIDALALEEVRQNGFLSAIRQRSGISGGTCVFDLPALHHWLQLDHKERTRQIEEWLAPFAPMHQALRLILRLIRTSAVPSNELAPEGFFQKTLDANAPNQLIQVLLPADSDVFPEISGGKHRFSIRFMVQSDPNQRSSPSSDDIVFRLVRCTI